MRDCTRSLPLALALSHDALTEETDFEELAKAPWLLQMIDRFFILFERRAAAIKPSRASPGQWRRHVVEAVLPWACH